MAFEMTGGFGPDGADYAEGTWTEITDPSELHAGEFARVTTELFDVPEGVPAERLLSLSLTVDGVVQEPLPTIGEVCGRQVWIGGIILKRGGDGPAFITSIGDALVNVGIPHGTYPGWISPDTHVRATKHLSVLSRAVSHDQPAEIHRAA